jgi:hypothetical protein
MEKTVNDLIKELQALKPSLREKPVVVCAPNGELFEAKIKQHVENPADVFEGKVENIIITYE